MSPDLTQLPGAETPRAGAGVQLSDCALTINQVLNPTGFALPRLKTPLGADTEVAAQAGLGRTFKNIP